MNSLVSFMEDGQKHWIFNTIEEISGISITQECNVSLCGQNYVKDSRVVTGYQNLQFERSYPARTVTHSFVPKLSLGKEETLAKNTSYIAPGCGGNG